MKKSDNGKAHYEAQKEKIRHFPYTINKTEKELQEMPPEELIKLQEEYKNLKNSVEEYETILSVLINGDFKSVAFVKVVDKHYIVIGDTSAYRAAMYRTASIGCVQAIECNEEWFEVTKEESDKIKNEIYASKKMNKKGYPYYRFNINKYLV